MSHVNDCEKFVRYLSEHFDGELDQELEVEFMMHFEHCERARALVHTFERTIVLHRETGKRETDKRSLPREVHERLLAAIRACEASDE